MQSSHTHHARTHKSVRPPTRVCKRLCCSAAAAVMWGVDVVDQQCSRAATVRPRLCQHVVRSDQLVRRDYVYAVMCIRWCVTQLGGALLQARAVEKAGRHGTMDVVVQQQPPPSLQLFTDDASERRRVPTHIVNPGCTWASVHLWRRDHGACNVHASGRGVPRGTDTTCTNADTTFCPRVTDSCV